jgi:hypothetical protein
VLPIYQSRGNLNFDAVSVLTPQQIDFDWFGEKLKNPAQFVMAVDSHKLYFVAQIGSSAHFDNSAAQGQFVEGLWTKDVAEFFVTNSGQTSYQEFNLSPTGAWWSCYFSKYRKRETSLFKMPQGVETFSVIEGSQWKAGLSIPLSEFSVPLALEESTRINVCFALGKAKRQYVSWAQIKKYEPDFHLAEDFEDVDLIALETDKA